LLNKAVWISVSVISRTSDEEVQTGPQVHFTLPVRLKWAFAPRNNLSTASRHS